ncbi:hypothetical protein VZ94_13575 [Methylocucumis oryzae]|uniref:DUF4393 domain-containing protein n=2 Tax=Methylocucumis oryzae TaxID=1632867 RepID=A0A0F3IHT8_9GAMM|nr:hypothetical protein VZ94_13575 [Methylocucumis oryzae]
MLDPVFSVAAAGLSAGLAKQAEEVLESAITRSELKRAETVVKHLAEVMERRIQNGERLRPDFAISDSETTPIGLEQLEAIVQKARASYEERKLPYMGNLYANVALDQSVSRTEANHLVLLSESLTFSQYGLLRLFAQHGSIPLREHRLDELPGVTTEQWSLYELCADLWNRRLIKRLMRGSSDNYETELGQNGIIPADVQLTTFGERVHDTLGLHTMPELDYMYMAPII